MHDNHKPAPTHAEALTFGFDIGMASVGWSVLSDSGVVDLGVRAFDRAEDEKGKPLNEHRRMMRTARVRLHRRADRLKKLGRLLRQSGLPDLQRSAPAESPWTLRARGLDERLAPGEWIQVLHHLVKHRGFFAARKADTMTVDTEGGKLSQGVVKTSQMLAAGGWRTLGEMAAKDAAFADSKRNKAGEYHKSFSRALLREELAMLFQRQRELGNPHCDAQLEAAVDQLFWWQQPAMSAEQMRHMLGHCTFEPSEFRASKRSLSAERFIWLSKLNHVRIVQAGDRRALTPAERQAAINLPYESARVTYRQLRRAIQLDDPEAGFAGLSYGTKRKKNGELADPEEALLVQLTGWHDIRKALASNDLGITWERLKAQAFGGHHESLDALAEAASLHKSDADLRPALRAIGFDERESEALLGLDFVGFIQLSTKALTRLMPHLEAGMRYDEACSAAGYDHNRPDDDGLRHRLLPELPHRFIERKGRRVKVYEMRNPVVLRALNQARRVLNALVERHGSPCAVHVELARDLSKSFDERREIQKGQEAFRQDKELAVARFREHFGRNPRRDELLKFRLYREQDGQCAYSQTALDIHRLIDEGYAEIDHALPYARSFDDSQNNKVLVHCAENRQKGNRTPYEYLDGASDSARWRAFEAWVRGHKSIRRAKKERLLRRHFDEREAREFSERNLNDTRYITRYFAQFVRQNLAFSPDGKGTCKAKPVLSPAGAFTSFLRARWGLLKDREASDLHHALDACVIAAASETLQKRVSDFHRRALLVQLPNGSFADPATGEIVQPSEQAALDAHFPQPWPHFRDEVLARLLPDPGQALAALHLLPDGVAAKQVRPVLVSRAVKRRAAGPVHKETIRSVKTHLGPQTSSKRTWLVDLKPADLAHIVGAGDPRNAGLMAALRERLVRFGGDGRKAFEEPVFKPRANGTPGPLIRAVKVTTIQKGGVAVRGGVADQASIWRVDVFSKAGKFYLVPVYQSDRRPTTELPSRAALAYADRSEWTLMDGSFAFRFSLFPNDYVALTTKKAVYRGYFVAMDISTASISIASHDRNAHAGKDGTWRSIGVKAGVLSFEKFHVDVLGRVFAAKQEVRHGLA